MNQYFSKLLSTRSPILLLIACIAITSCSDDTASNGRPGKGKGGGGKFKGKPVPVEIAHPKLGTASSVYVTTLTLSASSDAKINARTAGVIRELIHEEGDDVKAGDILLILENDDQRLRLKQAKIQQSSAKREYDRLNKMKSAGAVSANDWEASYNTYQKSNTDLELAKLALSYTKIVAPFDGRVVWREVDLGAYVTNGALLFRMMSIHPLLLKVHVPANRIENVTIGQPVKLSIESISEPLEATVSLISPIVDPATGTVKVTVSLEDYPVGVRPGDFTEIEMTTNQRQNALLISSMAIIEERGQNYLYLDDGGKATRRKVDVGYVLGEQTEITSGITLSDRVIIKGQRNLNEGNPIKQMNLGDGSPEPSKSPEPNKRKDKRKGKGKRKPS